MSFQGRRNDDEAVGADGRGEAAFLHRADRLDPPVDETHPTHVDESHGRDDLAPDLRVSHGVREPRVASPSRLTRRPAKSSYAHRHASGSPGSRTTGAVSARPIPVEPPGRTAMPWIASSPTSASASGASSSRPVPVRPATTIMSAPGAAIACAIAPRSFAPTTTDSIAPPSRATRARSSGPSASRPGGSDRSLRPGDDEADAGAPDDLHAPSAASSATSCARNARVPSTTGSGPQLAGAMLHACTLRDRGQNLESLALDGGRAEREDRVSASRQRCTGGRERRGRRTEWRPGLLQREEERVVRRCADGLARANGVAVLGRTIDIREVRWRVDRRVEDAAGRVARGDRLRRQPRALGIEPGHRLVDRGERGEPCRRTSWQRVIRPGSSRGMNHPSGSRGWRSP